jgi:hypothetical protein
MYNCNSFTFSILFAPPPPHTNGVSYLPCPTRIVQTSMTVTAPSFKLFLIPKTLGGTVFTIVWDSIDGGLPNGGPVYTVLLLFFKANPKRCAAPVGGILSPHFPLSHPTLHISRTHAKKFPASHANSTTFSVSPL